MRRILLAGLCFLAAGTAWAAAPPGINSILFWTPAQQLAGYPHVERSFPVRAVRHGKTVYPLPIGKPAPPVSFSFGGKTFDTDKFIAANRLSGLLIVKAGKIVLERYALGRKPQDRWVSFSVTKSITSLLLGAAISDGYIKSIDAPVTDYLPALKKSAYAGVTIRQLLTMSSGVKWNEDYADPHSDVARFALGNPGPHGENPIVSYMAKLPRAEKPGVHFVYKTGESDLVGILVEAATHKHLADYLSEKIWQPFGMEADATWMLDRSGSEIGGCCVSMTLRDYARVGLFVMGGTMAGGKRVVPADYLKAATMHQLPTGYPNTGYGFQWWIHDDNGAFEAEGIFGQSIYINPREKLVIAMNSAWPVADDEVHDALNDAYQRAIVAALHGR
ncbi:MAG: serine hydrolase [Proteobacteria bacterium]|nr:serine hydrolase [Pseudomonadota bacterium]